MFFIFTTQITDYRNHVRQIFQYVYRAVIMETDQFLNVIHVEKIITLRQITIIDNNKTIKLAK